MKNTGKSKKMSGKPMKKTGKLKKK